MEDTNHDCGCGETAALFCLFSVVPNVTVGPPPVDVVEPPVAAPGFAQMPLYQACTLPISAGVHSP